MKIRLGVFFGGASVEHEVSIITAIQAMNALDKEKYEITPIYVSKNNCMYCGEDIGSISAYKNIPELLKKSTQITLVRSDGRVKAVRFPAKRFADNTVAEIDVAFPMGHGTDMEDGALQGYLRMLGVPFVGCGVLESAVGMNKYLQKIILRQSDIPVLDGVRAFNTGNDDGVTGAVKKLEESGDYPFIVKPSNLGSSVGIKIARNREELTEAMEYAFMFSNELLIERAVTNLKEVNVSVLGDHFETIVSECEEPLRSESDGGILSYSDKYASGGPKNSGMASLSRKIPADITAEQKEKIKDIAAEAFRVLNCNGVARLDFILDMDSGEIYFNEINTLPGSLSFYLWEPAGMKYTELLDRMIALALKRDREQKSIKSSFETNILENAPLGGAKGSKR